MTEEPASSAPEVPSFAREFPDDPELAALVRAFSAGDFARVRAEAPKLAARASDEKVKAAAQALRERTETDPLSKLLLLLTLVLLVGLTLYWVAEDGPKGAPAKAAPPPLVERINDWPSPAPPVPSSAPSR